MTIVFEMAIVGLTAAGMWTLYSMFGDKRDSVKSYLAHVYAYKTGLIRKYAEVNEVDLVFPPTSGEDEFMTKLEDGVCKDIESVKDI